MKTKELKAVTWNDVEILLVAFAQEQAALRRGGVN